MRRTPLQPRPPADRTREPGYREWHSPLRGLCAVCGQPGPLERHHVVTERHVRDAGGDPWDLRNALELGRYCRCHREHHSAARRLSLTALSPEAIAFAYELLGEDAGGEYLARFYRE